MYAPGPNAPRAHGDLSPLGGQSSGVLVEWLLSSRLQFQPAQRVFQTVIRSTASVAFLTAKKLFKNLEQNIENRMLLKDADMQWSVSILRGVGTPCGAQQSLAEHSNGTSQGTDLC